MNAFHSKEIFRIAADASDVGKYYDEPGSILSALLRL